MNKKSMYIVFPKMSAYEYKDNVTQRILEETAALWYKRVKDMGYTVLVFAEDLLGQILFKSNNVTFMSVLGRSDLYFMKNKVEGIPEFYWEKEKYLVESNTIRESVLKYKLPDKDTSPDESSYNGLRFRTLCNRVRYVANRVLAEAPFVVYMDAKNNYCNNVESVIGDGRLLATIDITNGVTMYWYGGIPLNESDYMMILGGQ